ncbi:MAG: hypothetical protein J6S18_03265 [Oscillospiraceae bacterium]|nr:hypothetical protein [Oscillospiraceae bacterium]
MKKLRYYAPYWISLLIVISAVIAIPAYKRSKEITLTRKDTDTYTLNYD